MTNEQKTTGCSVCAEIKSTRRDAADQGDLDTMKAMTIRMGVHQREAHG
ncbi:hypothetical protein [Streptomyces sp. ISL-11]|nr:hypothetical protein [Streptomyces sp. ISL-11]MBT2386423.1 hypothetical protein [Streptomyces sp. ISL-11]